MKRLNRILLFVILVVSTISTYAQTSPDTLNFFVPTVQQAYPGRIISLAKIIVNGNNVTTSLTSAPSGIPYISKSTKFYGNVMAFSPGTGSTNQVNLLNLSNYQQSNSGPLPFSPTAMASDAIAIFVGSSSNNQIIKIKQNLAIDNNFNCKFGAMDVCFGLVEDNDVLYALIVNTPQSIYGPKSRIVAIDRSSGAQLGSFDVGASSMFTVSNDKILVAKTYRDTWKPETNHTTIKVLSVTRNIRSNVITSVSFAQLGSDISQNYSLSDLHLGLDENGYGLFYEGKLGKINLSNGTLTSTTSIQPELDQMKIPFKMFTSSTKAFIFWAQNDNPAWTQVVVSDLSAPGTVLGAQNTGLNAHAIQLLNR